MISVVIRNKNEATSLEKVLRVLTTFYSNDIVEIIIVDNESTDSSLSIARDYNCEIIIIKDFTYGRAINLGIEKASQPYILLLSAHAYPIGASFFKSSIDILNNDKSIAGIRYINSVPNYINALDNKSVVDNPLEKGLMAACAMVRKQVWEKHKFNEKLPFSEDKEWSQRIVDNGFIIYNLNETFFYSIKRTRKGNFNRWKNETIATHVLSDKKPVSRVKSITSFFYKIIYKNPKQLLLYYINDFKTLMVHLNLKSEIKKVKEFLNHE